MLTCILNVFDSWVHLKRDPKKTEHLLALDGAKERLHLFKAELLDKGAFDSVVDGCEGVFHTASPFYLNVKDPQQPYLACLLKHVANGRRNKLAEMIDPAVKGTLNVLRSCAKVPSIKRVVITSSIVAVIFNGRPLGPDVIVDETWFSDPSFCEKSKLWYMLSKTLAEEAAWKYAKENGIDMVTVNPGLVIGPLLQPTINTSVEPILKLINGAETFPNTSYRLIDVRDVANTHILAYENSSACGRYLLVERVMHCSKIVQTLRELYPALRLPERCADEKLGVPVFQVSNDRAKSLGVNFTPMEVSIKDTVQSLKEKNFFSG
ncbi:cinnamoyl-CoA reductase 1-like isoform X3 [Herrania umbratica]|uniref:Cinnamoyl-CoA reductase 1-like isoform X3 n=1 Tax=Herrania umbratica TaxID=108875 RepID=A0A6J1A3W1_9ROSI|nr:cinnamoyl-CoA reductase 1-like isoform X3 [Herrania umbratica]